MVLRAKRGYFRAEMCLKSKRMLTERHNRNKILTSVILRFSVLQKTLYTIHVKSFLPATNHAGTSYIMRLTPTQARTNRKRDKDGIAHQETTVCGVPQMSLPAGRWKMRRPNSEAMTMA